jgi:hypothetical protein
LNLNTNTVTFVAWIFPTNLEAGSSAIFLNRNAGTVAGFAYCSTATNNAYVLGYTWNNNESATWGWNGSGVFPPTNQWSMAALTITPTNCTIYCLSALGVQQGSFAHVNTSMSFAGTSYIGYDSLYTGKIFQGSIDEVAVFAYSLTQAQLMSIFSAASSFTGPAITTNPVSLAVGVGQTATFSGAGNGSPTLAYQWQAGATNSGVYTNLVVSGGFSGTATPTLTITDASLSDTLNYTLVLSNAFGSVTSSVATLTVVPPPATHFSLSPNTGPAPLPVAFVNDTLQGTS